MGYQIYCILYLIAFGGTPIDSLNFEGITFRDSAILSDFIVTMGFLKVAYGSLTSEQTVFENIGAFRTNMMRYIAIGSVEVSNVRITNVSGPLEESLNFISLINFPSTPTVFQNITISGLVFGNGGLVDMSTALDTIQIKHVSISDSIIKPGLAVFKLNLIKNLLIDNFEATNIQVTQTDDEDSTIFRVNSLDASGDLNSTFGNAVISN